MTGGILPTKRVVKPWGRTRLPAPFANVDSERIGEIWFEPPKGFDALLAKYLFTSEKLSVQVHPSDAQAGERCGKEECWLILDAKPGTKLAAGFRKPVSAGRMRDAAMDGSIEELLDWHEVAAGDFLYIPAGTVHAIGSGISLIEIQQNCDTTYRLYDYGRPRDLHLDEAVSVARGEPHPAEHRQSIARNESRILVDGPYFRVAHCFGAPDRDMMNRFPDDCLIMPIEGSFGLENFYIPSGSAGWVAKLPAAGFSPEGRFLLAAPVSPKN